SDTNRSFNMGSGTIGPMSPLVLVGSPLVLVGESTDEAREAPMEDQQYFLQKANRCFEIGRTCMDLAAARKINELGDEFLKTAKKSERDARFPSGDSDRDFAA